MQAPAPAPRLGGRVRVDARGVDTTDPSASLVGDIGPADGAVRDAPA
jgi:hypothetical protein